MCFHCTFPLGISYRHALLPIEIETQAQFPQKIHDPPHHDDIIIYRVYKHSNALQLFPS